MSSTYDLVVVGGGPGGSTAATFVAMQGHRVLLLERESLPIYKIGESLLPSTVNGVCAMLGVTDELRRAQFVVKRGGTFRWGSSPQPWTFLFSASPAIKGPASFAYQVERIKFDTILLENAKKHGVDVRERCVATDVLVDDDGRVCGLGYRQASGERFEARSRYVIDASGWTSCLNRHVGERIYSEFFRNIAVFGYFRNGGRLPAPCSGNIFSVAFKSGWFWYIPLSDTLTSVGAVLGQEHADVLDVGPEEALHSLIQECPEVRVLLRNATPETQAPYDRVRVRKDFSYCHSKFWRPGMALVGDAACFIDPVFSSGVHLSTYSALLAARAVNTCLRGLLNEKRVFDEFERRYRREFRCFYDFLIAFYDVNQDVDSYYWAARKILNSAEPESAAFVRLVAGVSSDSEELYESSEEFLLRRSQLGTQLFPGGSPNADVAALAGEDALARDRFYSALFREPAALVADAHSARLRMNATPLFADGLVQSPDGLHWSEPGTHA